MAGGGLCLAHDTIAGALLKQGRLIAPFEHRAAMPEAYYLLLSPQAEELPGAVAFVDWLREEVAVDTMLSG